MWKFLRSILLWYTIEIVECNWIIVVCSPKSIPLCRPSLYIFRVTWDLKSALIFMSEVCSVNRTLESGVQFAWLQSVVFSLHDFRGWCLVYMTSEYGVQFTWLKSVVLSLQDFSNFHRAVRQGVLVTFPVAPF